MFSSGNVENSINKLSVSTPFTFKIIADILELKKFDKNWNINQSKWDIFEEICFLNLQ